MSALKILLVIPLLCATGCVAAVRSNENVCLSDVTSLDAQSTLMCGDCFKNGDCGFPADLDKAFSTYRSAGNKGLLIGYSNAAWVMLNQNRVPKERPLFEQLVRQGLPDPVGIGRYLQLMDRLAMSNGTGLDELFKSFESAAFDGGLPANLLAMYFMLEHSRCESQQNEVLVRQKRLLESQQYARRFSLQQWNQKVDRDAVLGANARVLHSLNTNWNDAVLKGDWCQNVTLPRPRE